MSNRLISLPAQSPPIGKWIVHTKGGPGSKLFEIAVLREDDKFHQHSYGWFDNKSKYYISSSGGPCNDVVILEIWYGLLAVARRLADYLNDTR